MSLYDLNFHGDSRKLESVSSVSVVSAGRGVNINHHGVYLVKSEGGGDLSLSNNSRLGEGLGSLNKSRLRNNGSLLDGIGRLRNNGGLLNGVGRLSNEGLMVHNRSLLDGIGRLGNDGGLLDGVGGLSDQGRLREVLSENLRLLGNHLVGLRNSGRESNGVRGDCEGLHYKARLCSSRVLFMFTFKLWILNIDHSFLV